MNKTLRKTIEKEVQSAIDTLFTRRNRKASEAIAKNIRDASKSLSKKFVKHLPAPVQVKSVATSVSAKTKSAKKKVSAKSNGKKTRTTAARGKKKAGATTRKKR